MINNSFYHYEASRNGVLKLCMDHHEVTAFLDIKRHQLNYILKHPSNKKFAGLCIKRVKIPVYDRVRRPSTHDCMFPESSSETSGA